MVKLELYLSDEDYDRLRAVKLIQEQEHNINTISGSATDLLCGDLHRLFPALAKFDSDGNLINPDEYRPTCNISAKCLKRLLKWE